MNDIAHFCGVYILAASCVSYLIGEYMGRRCGIIEGYGALLWPDSEAFSFARKFLNKHRKASGLPTIEEAAE